MEISARIGCRSKIAIPKGYEILCVQAQNNKIVLWCSVLPKATKDILYIEIIGIGTGLPFEYNPTRKYIGTCQIHDSIWHIFNKYGNS